jgi:hypothetical protein
LLVRASNLQTTAVKEDDRYGHVLNFRAFSGILALVGMLVVFGACHKGDASGQAAVDLLAVDVSASQSLNADAFNKQLIVSHTEGQSWANDPIQIVSRFINPELPRNAIWVVNGSGERPSRYQITVVVDGIPDDSLRGRRYDATILRAQDGAWQIVDAGTSWRCSRARTGVFGTEPCP